MDLYNVNQASSFTKIQEMSSLCQDEVRTFSTTVALSQTGKINPDQISQEALENVLEFLDLVTEAKGRVTPVKSTADIFTMPMFVLCLQQGSGDLLLHRPHSPHVARTSDEHV